jgi:hypothetical protein
MIGAHVETPAPTMLRSVPTEFVLTELKTAPVVADT